MNKLKQLTQRLTKNNRGQGMVEYILLLVVVVAIVMAAKPYLTDYVKGDLLGSLTEKIGGVLND